MAQTPHPSSPADTIISLSDENKRDILSYLPPDVKVIATASARIYHRPFGAAPDTWTSTGLCGMLVFGRNRITVYPDRPLGVREGMSIEQNYWFRLIDFENGKGVVWFHPISSDLDYHSDKPFFHTFSGCSRMFGFRFDEDSDAEKFRKRISRRIPITARIAGSRTATKSVPTSSPPTSPKVLLQPYSATDNNNANSNSNINNSRAAAAARIQPFRRLSPSMISAPSPGTFVHVAHIGFDADGHIETTPNLGPGWTTIIEELQGYGVTEKMVREDFDFVEGFLAGAKARLVKELRRTPTSAPSKGRRMPDGNEGDRRTRLMQLKRVPQAGHF